jgi:hypothetical protein
MVLVSAGAQEASAVDSATTAEPSAYDILGVSPAIESTGTLAQATTTDNVPASTPAQAAADADEATTDVEVSGEQPAVPTPEPTDATLAEPAPDVVSEASGTVSDNEAALMAEIMRLLAERDTLYQTINDLREENNTLTAQVSDYEYYKSRSAELESEIARLEGAIVEKDAALAAADARLADIEAKLAGEGAVRADAEAKLAAGTGDRSAIDSMLAARDATIAEKDAKLAEQNASIEAVKQELAKAKVDLELARAAASPASVTVASDTVGAVERRLVAMMAERDAAIEVRDSAIATRDAAETMVKAAEASRAEAEAALAAALATGAVIRTTPTTGYLSGWKLDTARFTTRLRSGFDGSASRIGSWKISGATASQTDASQYFSRLELPLAQTRVTTLYRFKARSTGSGWIGLGLHLFVEDVKKKRGYGEGKSLLVWFTRDRAARGDDATYLQLYRSDNDVVMERMFDAELADGIGAWKSVEILYDPGAEYIAVSVDGVLRIVYKTFFGRDSGATVSLRTLGGGGSFSDFSAWTE